MRSEKSAREQRRGSRHSAGAPGILAALGNARGQSTIMLAILLPSLVGAMALGIDISVFYFNWAKLQRAADAGALAGAAYLPGNTALATSAAHDFASLNSIADSEIVSSVIAPDNKSITVHYSRNVPYYFARVLGLTSGQVAARATAAVQIAGGARGIVPVGVQYNTSYSYGQQLTLRPGVGPGNWSSLALGGTGASNYRTNLEYGYQELISVGDLVATETGVMAGPNRQGFDARIAAGLSQFPSGTFSDHSLSDPRVVVVPMVDFGGIAGASQVPVQGFAVLWITSVSADGKDITAFFIEQTVPGSEPGTSGSNFGAYRAVLIE
jgi:Flp pilus assembly protein TadG